MTLKGCGDDHAMNFMFPVISDEALLSFSGVLFSNDSMNYTLMYHPHLMEPAYSKLILEQTSDTNCEIIWSQPCGL